MKAGTVRSLGVAIAMIAALWAFPAHASSLSLTVSPLVVELHGKPGETLNTNVLVRNDGLEPVRVVSQRMDWRTTIDGSLRVERIGAEGASSLSDHLRLAPSEVILSPGESRNLALTLELPRDMSPDAHVTWGGFFLRGLPASGSTAVIGPAATVVVYNTIGSPRAHARLTQVHVSQQGADAAQIVARIVNDGVMYVRPTIRTVISQSGRIVSDSSDNTPVIFAGATRLFTKNVGGLRAGAYDVELTIDYGGSTLIAGTTQFTLK